MAQPKELAQLAERRRLLLAESERLRHRLAEETAELQVAAGWIERGVGFVQSLQAWWPLVAAGAGFFMARKRGGWLQLFGKAWSIWRVVKQFEPLWRQFSSANPPAK